MPDFKKREGGAVAMIFTGLTGDDAPVGPPTEPQAG
jgi:hypothetical protein